MHDVFIEHMVKQKKNGKDYAIIAGIILAYLALIYLALMFIQYVAFLFPLIVIGGIYGVYWFISARNLEYEYIVTNGTLDVDKIIAKRNRKRVFSCDAKDFELCAPVDSNDYRDFMRSQENNRDLGSLDASSRTDDRRVWFVVGKNAKDQERMVVLFEPTEAMMNDLYRRNPRNIRYNPQLGL